MKESRLVVPTTLKPEENIVANINDFLTKFNTYENRSRAPVVLLYDTCSQAYYIICHLEGHILSTNTDLEAVLDPTEGEEYKLNRDLYTDNYAYKVMEQDALNSRSFEDIVVEYDTLYRENKPLKVFGGQHRIRAIQEAIKNDVNSVHGVRIFFNLSQEQKVNIAMVNNTSITVPNDLLDRMQEELLGPELRNWSQKIGLLLQEQNFSDKRTSEGTPTVRIIRSLIVNFYKGKVSKSKEFHKPIVCSSGPELDREYSKIRPHIDWHDAALIKMGEQFALLHQKQRKTVLERSVDKHLEFANKALHPSVASSWAYASGFFQSNKDALTAHYNLINSVAPPKDPLNAKALVNARLKGVDPDTYRGLGSRINQEELGRMLEVFLIQATKATKRGITDRLANAAIQSYTAIKANEVATKAMKNI